MSAIPPQPPLDLCLPWTVGRTEANQIMFLDSKGRYCGAVRIHQTPHVMGTYDEERRRACAELILAAVNRTHYEHEAAMERERQALEWAKGSRQ